MTDKARFDYVSYFPRLKKVGYDAIAPRHFVSTFGFRYGWQYWMVCVPFAAVSLWLFWEGMAMRRLASLF